MKSSGKFHVLVTILHTQNFTKIHQFVLKILNANKILTSIKGHNCWKIICNCLTYILSISMHLQNFIKIHQLVHKILSINTISTSIKGHKLVENEQKILFNYPNLHLVNIDAYTQNLIKIHKLLSINKILMSIKGHNSVKRWPKIVCIRYNMDNLFYRCI